MRRTSGFSQLRRSRSTSDASVIILLIARVVALVCWIFAAGSGDNAFHSCA